MEAKKVQDMFHLFNQKYFWGKLDKVKLNWSENMTLCTGKTYCKQQRGYNYCSIYLSKPLLSQRPPDDTINTLLHEMIHAYLFLTQGNNVKSGHGPEFREHLNRINKLQGSKITLFHNFHKEVDKFRVHVYRCDGPCTKKRPYFGVLRRAVTRPPGPSDRWWLKHSQECGGTFHKIEGPDITPDKHSTSKPERAPPVHLPRNPSPLCTPSPKRENSPESESSEDMGKPGKGKDIKSVRKKLRFSQGKSTDEDQLIQKIKKRHAHTKKSILLPSYKGNSSWRGPSPERGTLVDGRVNYNYRMKSSLRFDINKYIDRYRALEAREQKMCPRTEVSQSPATSSDVQMYTSPQTCSTSFQRSEASHTTVPAAVTCWNCGVNVPVPKPVQHSHKEHKEHKEQSIHNTPKITPQRKEEDSEVMICQTLVPCPSCGKKIPEKEINGHLDECLLPFTDEF